MLCSLIFEFRKLHLSNKKRYKVWRQEVWFFISVLPREKTWLCSEKLQKFEKFKVLSLGDGNLPFFIIYSWTSLEIYKDYRAITLSPMSNVRKSGPAVKLCEANLKGEHWTPNMWGKSVKTLKTNNFLILKSNGFLPPI